MNSSFERTIGKEEWITPPNIVKELGEFDLDPCASENSIYQYGKYSNFYKKDNGLMLKWFGRVWCNPPYGSKGKDFIAKLSKHNNGILLIFARTETKVWHEHIWNKADGILFIKGRLKFLYPDGKEGDCAGSPSCLIAYGKENFEALKKCNIPGKVVALSR